MMFWLAIGLACTDPVLLPPSAVPSPAPEARMVRSGGVQGYLVRPPSGQPTQGVVIWVDTLTDPVRARARALAAEGTLLLATAAPDPEPARQYLAGIDGIAQVSIRCERAQCPSP